MAERAKKFIPRAPRYKLRPLDNKFLRFAHQDEEGRSYTTQFCDISVSGVSFVTDLAHAPGVGEIIKIEIPLSDTEKIAWFGEVARIEKYNPYKWWLQKEWMHNEKIVLVAVSFKQLPEGHRRRIRNTLRRKFAEVQKENRIRTAVNFAKYASENVLKVSIYVLAAVATAMFLWFLSQPSDNYDAEKGSPWMQRFPGLNLFDKNYK